MKILFMRFPLESAFGGAEVQTLSLMKGLRERGYHVSFLGSCKTLLMHAARHSFPTTRLTIGSPPVTPWLAIRFFWERKNMRKALMEATKYLQKGDIVFCLSLLEKLLLTRLLHARGVKVFWIEHDAVGRWLEKNPWLPLLRRESSAATIITVSTLSRDMYLTLGFDSARVLCIPNGIDTDTFSPAHHRSFAHQAGLHLGCIARLSADKGIDLLLRALCVLPTVSLSLLGKGPEEGRLRTLARSLCPGRVHFLPPLQQEEIARFYPTIDVLILPSRKHDPFGLVVAEAMASGTPVLITRACGISSYLHDGEDAIVIDENSISALIEGIKILQDSMIRQSLSVRGLLTVHSLFSLKSMVDRYEEILSL